VPWRDRGIAELVKAQARRARTARSRAGDLQPGIRAPRRGGSGAEDLSDPPREVVSAARAGGRGDRVGLRCSARAPHQRPHQRRNLLAPPSRGGGGRGRESTARRCPRPGGMSQAAGSRRA
jgi:hypothetical protein